MAELDPWETEANSWSNGRSAAGGRGEETRWQGRRCPTVTFLMDAETPAVRSGDGEERRWGDLA